MRNRLRLSRAANGLLKLLLLVLVIGAANACTSLGSPFGISVHFSVDASVSFAPILAASTVMPTPTDNGSAATFEVWADKAWQDTHVVVRAGQTVIVTYVSGLWTEQQGVVPLHDSGSIGGLVCGRSDCAEPAPNAPKGSLIGRIGGGQIVEIGTAQRFVTDDSGTLALRINDPIPGCTTMPAA
ncbi:MAG: hypothetical protein ACYDBJ_27545 [Aggregatilineales bacterium]